MSEKAPLVSIGIPTYNRERLIGRAIESALHQDYPNIEIVISDNASTDATPEICRRYAQEQPNVRYVQQSRNLGATRNFDAVLQQSSGQFFMWLGDDDWLDPNYVRLALARLRHERRSRAGRRHASLLRKAAFIRERARSSVCSRAARGSACWLTTGR